MKLAVLSDIHSNNIALQACIDKIETIKVDGICLLGDYVSDCPNPQATLDLIKELKNHYKVWMIKGNREQYFIDHEDQADDGWGYTSYQGSLLYTYENLRKEDLEFFRSLPDNLIVKIPETESLFLTHGSPNYIKELLYKDGKNTKEVLDRIPTNYLLSGHTHIQTIYKYKKKLLINPGSVGVAIGDKETAHYCILEWNKGEWHAKLKGVSYDINKLSKSFYNSSLMEKGGVWPKCIIKSVKEGVNYGPLCARAARDYAIKDGVAIKKRPVSEKYWKLAAKDFGVL